MIKKEIEGKELKQVLHFRFSFEPRFSEVDKSLFLALPLRTTSCTVHYSGPILYDNERETWSKSIFILALSQWATPILTHSLIVSIQGEHFLRLNTLSFIFSWTFFCKSKKKSIFPPEPSSRKHDI